MSRMILANFSPEIKLTTVTRRRGCFRPLALSYPAADFFSTQEPPHV